MTSARESQFYPPWQIGKRGQDGTLWRGARLADYSEESINL